MKILLNMFYSLAIAIGFAATTGVQAETETSKLPVLTVTGQMSETNEGASFVFDMADLSALPQHSFTTHTPWHPEPHTFTGPLLRDVLAKVGAQGNQVDAIALNGYTSTLPIEDSERFDIIIARLLDGERMRVRDKGPLFIIYPYDQNEEAQSQIYYGRSVWQLKALHIQ